jgi:hypothetical protein
MFQPIQPANNRMHTATSERIMPFGKIAAAPSV